MIKLKLQTHKLRIALGESANIQLGCYASYKEWGSGIKNQDDVSLIMTNNATPVDFVAPPSAANVTRSVDTIIIPNRDNIPHTVKLFFNVDGADYPLFCVSPTVMAGGSLCYEDKKGWLLYNDKGQLLVSNNANPNWFNNRFLLTGALYETFDRNLCDEVNTAVLSTGRLSLQAIYLPSGVTINSISFWSATTAAATPTNQLFGLYDNNRNLLATSVNNTNTAWAANSRKTLALTAPFTTTYSGLYYLAIMVTAGTVPTLKGNTAKTGGQLNAEAPSMGGTSNTGLTTSLPATANAPGTVTTSFWGCVN